MYIRSNRLMNGNDKMECLQEKNSGETFTWPVFFFFFGWGTRHQTPPPPRKEEGGERAPPSASYISYKKKILIQILQFPRVPN